jgi:hypothetical protein
MPFDLFPAYFRSYDLDLNGSISVVIPLLVFNFIDFNFYQYLSNRFTGPLSSQTPVYSVVLRTVSKFTINACIMHHLL